MISIKAAQREKLIADLIDAVRETGEQVSEHDIRGLVNQVVDAPTVAPLDATEKDAIRTALRRVAVNAFGGGATGVIDQVLSAVLS